MSGSRSSIPLRKRDRDKLVARVSARQRGVEREICERAELSAEAVELNRRRLSLTNDKWTCLKLQLSSVAKQATRAFEEKKSMHHTQEEVSAQAERLLKKRVDSKRPDWVNVLADAEFVIMQFKYSAGTKWRSKVREVLEVTRMHALRTFGSSAFTLRASETIRDVNALSPEELLDRIRQLVVETEEVDRIWGARSRVLRDHQDTVRASNVKHRQSITRLADSITQERKPLLHKMGACYQYAVSQSKNKTVRPETHTIGHKEQLKAVESSHSTRNSHERKRIEYNHLLAQFSSKGEFASALATLRSMQEQDVATGEDVYKMVFGSVKRAGENQAHIVYNLLNELRHAAQPPSVALCNIALGTLISRSLWRVAARILCLMSESRIRANTATYDILMRVCGNAKASDSPFIYDAFKYAGLPEAIAYACARRT